MSAGPLDLLATLVLLATFAGVTLTRAGVLETPTGGLGQIDRPAPVMRGGI